MAEESDGSVVLTTGYQSDEADMLAHEIRGDIGKSGKNGETKSEAARKAAAKKAAAAEKQAEADERKAAKERKDKQIQEEKDRRKREREAEDVVEEEPEVKKPKAKRHKKPSRKHTAETEEEESEEEEAHPKPRKKGKGKKKDPVEVVDKEEDSEDNEKEVEPAKPVKVPNWSKLTRDQRDLLTNANYEVDTVNSLTHAEACRICDALRKEREQEEKEAGKLGEVVKRVEERAVKEKVYAEFTEDGTTKHHPSRFEPLGWDYEKYACNVKRSVFPRREQQWEEELGMEVGGANCILIVQ